LYQSITADHGVVLSACCVNDSGISARLLGALRQPAAQERDPLLLRRDIASASAWISGS
jgi:hypothetical protein